jgi:hypothetical protein
MSTAAAPDTTYITSDQLARFLSFIENHDSFSTGDPGWMIVLRLSSDPEADADADADTDAVAVAIAVADADDAPDGANDSDAVAAAAATTTVSSVIRNKTDQIAGIRARYSEGTTASENNNIIPEDVIPLILELANSFYKQYILATDPEAEWKQKQQLMNIASKDCYHRKCARCGRCVTCLSADSAPDQISPATDLGGREITFEQLLSNKLSNKQSQ